MQPRFQTDRSSSLQYRQKKDFNNFTAGNAFRVKIATLLSHMNQPVRLHMVMHTKYIATCILGDDTFEGAVVERRGRFKVTSADLNPKGPANYLNSASSSSASPSTPSHSAALILPILQCILQQNTMQREEIIKLVNFVEQTSGNPADLTESGINSLSQLIPSSAKERELQAHMIQMQQSIGSLVEELQRLKTKNTQLERKLNAMLKKDDTIPE
ncbi:hypothetical protein MIMGU_mgv1a013690mg [Erythranthe guttata]|uniref:Uncharacterized protein n=1 Tax=Erythranthe guttata TaxID=4155 RepID=A0A022RXG5_ERYGU|nr:hypothetical protein MIMGU_mgv1a013690mg [Erythranthe guttata]